MKKSLLFIINILICLSLIACSSMENDHKTTFDSVFINDEYPSFVVENKNSSAGSKDEVVYVSLKDNTGFLTMALKVEYDMSAMVLSEMKCGSDFSDYNFVGAKNLKSGCTASWFIPELPKDVKDGILLELHFNIIGSAKSGKYPVKVSRADNGGIVDGNKKVLIVNESIGYITIE